MDLPRTIVGGVGYYNLSDLSLGPWIAAELAQEPWPSHVEVDDLSYGPIAVVHKFQESSPPYERLVLVGAVDRGLPATSLRSYRWDGVLPGAEEVQRRVAEAVTGVVDLDNLLVVGRQFQALPDEVFVVEIQPLRMEHGLETSPEVEALFPEIARRVRQLAEAPSGELPAAACSLGGLHSSS